jgi:membrane carboxypeptidase/penicillin-binding protein
MTALLAFFRANPILSLVAAVAVLASTGAVVQTWRINGLQERVGALTAEIDECARANESNQRTIEALESASKRNAARYAEALERAERAADRIGQLETQIEQEADDDIRTITMDESACGDTALPDAVRVLFAESGDQDE